MLHAGLIGFPSTGKTTLFRLLTRAREGPPFDSRSGRPDHRQGARAAGARVDAALGIARVPDARLDRLADIFEPRRRVPAAVEFADTPGGRTEARALIDVAAFRNADALLHVVRLFRDETVPRHADSLDPVRDARAMEEELILADLGVTERRLERIARDLKKGAGKEFGREADTLARCREALENGTPLRTLAFEAEDEKRLRGFQFLSAKPVLLVLNLDERDIGRAAEMAGEPGLAAFVAAARAGLVTVCARIELEIAQLEEADAAAFLADLGLAESGLDRIIRAAYELVGYLAFFTVSEEECRAWSIRRGTVAQEAAGEVHTDMARGFIRAEVARYEDVVRRGGLAGCREHGEVRLEGKDYVVADGDVITFRFAT